MAKQTFNIDKNANFSEWFTEIVKLAELADLRYNVKGFLVFQPWSVKAMEKMYGHMEKALQRKGHEPYWYPTVIPEKNFTLESSHVEGFTPEVFWVTQGGSTKFDEKLALRPTSETAFYQMFSLWIRSYKQLPFKTYQRANVFRYETKATRPFLRSREFHWIETHCVHASEEDALKQVHEDMKTTHEVLGDIFGLPLIFFKRPKWDTFPGATSTFAADVLNPDGRVVQQPSTHLISPNFSKAFDVKYKDNKGENQLGHITCYGPAISRIFASVAIVHGDNKGLRFPWKIAPVQVVVAPINNEDNLVSKAHELKNMLWENDIDAHVDDRDVPPGGKFYHWEMKGVPLRIEIGNRELEKKEFTVFRRDLGEKLTVKERNLLDYIKETAKEYDSNLFREANALFGESMADVDSLDAIKAAGEGAKIFRCNFCSTSMEGEKCAEVIEKETSFKVRGTKLEKEEASGDCIVCSKKAEEVVYIAREY
jgi:prolyl-tRNA synthetase